MSNTVKANILSAVAVVVIAAVTVLVAVLVAPAPSAQPAPVQGVHKSLEQLTAEVEHVSAYNRGWLDAEKGARAEVGALYPGRDDLARDYEDGQVDGRANAR